MTLNERERGEGEEVKEEEK